MPATLVAVFDHNPDTIEMLCLALQQHGLPSVGADLTQMENGDAHIADFFTRHDPAVVVYDISSPYEQSWELLQQFRAVPAVRGRPFVLSSTNPGRVEALAGRRRQEVLGKPYDLGAIVRAVVAALAGPRESVEDEH
jgi:CheY-like chemotaxis protein